MAKRLKVVAAPPREYPQEGRLPRLWDGAEVAVVATGPSATASAVDGLRGVLPCVVVNESYRVAPWADVLVAHDSAWWAARPDLAFEGLRVSAQPHAGVIVFPVRAERVTIAPNHDVEICSSGIMAIRVAVAAGAGALRLIGFDGGDGHALDRAPRPEAVIRPTALALEALVASLAAKGIKVAR